MRNRRSQLVNVDNRFDLCTVSISISISRVESAHSKRLSAVYGQNQAIDIKPDAIKQANLTN